MLGGGASKRGVPETEGNMDRRAGPGGQGPDNGSNDEEFGFCSKCDPFFLKNKLFILKYLGFENWEDSIEFPYTTSNFPLINILH